MNNCECKHVYPKTINKKEKKTLPFNVSKYKEQTNYYPCKNRTACYRTNDRFYNISK